MVSWRAPILRLQLANGVPRLLIEDALAAPSDSAGHRHVRESPWGAGGCCAAARMSVAKHDHFALRHLRRARTAFRSHPCDSARHIRFPRSPEASAPTEAIHGGTETPRE